MKSSVEIAQPWLTFEAEYVPHSDVMLFASLFGVIILMGCVAGLCFALETFFPGLFQKLLFWKNKKDKT